MPLVIVAVGILTLLVLIMGLKLNTFISLIIVSFGVALSLGMPLAEVVKSIEAGLGGTLGHLALIFGLGAMLGKLIADSGGAQRIAMTLVAKFGEKNIQWAVVVASFNRICHFKTIKGVYFISWHSDGNSFIRDTRFLTATPRTNSNCW
jgi:GntP family gluconate:H+ symporter